MNTERWTVNPLHRDMVCTNTDKPTHVATVWGPNPDEVMRRAQLAALAPEAVALLRAMFPAPDPRQAPPWTRPAEWADLVRDARALLERAPA